MPHPLFVLNGTLTASQVQVDSAMTSSIRPPYWPSSARCVFTTTPAGMNHSQRRANKKPHTRASVCIRQ